MLAKSTTPAPSFVQVYTQAGRDCMKSSFLRRINACVDWRGIRTLLNKKYTKAQNDVGNSAYDALMMFKILLMQVEATKLAKQLRNDYEDDVRLRANNKH